jgi:AraC-like DNA-binding protein
LRLLASYLGILNDMSALAAPGLGQRAVTHILDLVALAIGATGDAEEVARGRGLRAARLNAMKADIVARLGEEELSVAQIAARFGVTTRYVHMLFEPEGVTFSEYLTEQRLIRAYRILTDARFAARTISTVAYDVGFSNLSHFNRVFRRRYNATPSEVREAAWREKRE